MSPIPPGSTTRFPHTLRLLATVFTQYVPRFLRHAFNASSSATIGGSAGGHVLRKRDEELDHTDFIVYSCLIPILVLMSGVFAGLTLGYMSLDDTQLQVLSISGTPKQREYAKKIQPIRKNGHLLLVTLLLANMIVNESLPIIADPILGGGFESVVVSTALIVIFAEIIPQSIFTRHGLYLGAKMAWLTRILIYGLGIISWPVAKLLEFALGPHHGIIYRRAELKELIAMHSSLHPLGGDLKRDTVTIIGATLDLQEKVVRQAMTPIDKVFMLDINSRLDYDTLRDVCNTGHSRIPVYEEVEVPVHPSGRKSMDGSNKPAPTQKVKKIVGILLVKQCVLLDPKDAVPVRSLRLNRVPFVPQNMPLLGILDKFQEGRSHMAIVSRFSVDKAASIKQVVKRNMTQRLRARVGMGDSSDTSSDEEQEKESGFKIRRKHKVKDIEEAVELDDDDREATLRGDAGVQEKDFAYPSMPAPETFNEKEDAPRTSATSPIRRGRGKTRANLSRENSTKSQGAAGTEETSVTRRRGSGLQLPKAALGMTSMSNLEQSMPADAVLNKAGAQELLQSFDPAVMPLGIITLEDVLEELIGEEIYDEFDYEGAHGDPVVPLDQQEVVGTTDNGVKDESGTAPTISQPKPTQTPVLKPLALKGLSFLRSRSAPPSPRDATNMKIPEPSQAGASSSGTTNAPSSPPPPGQEPVSDSGSNAPAIVVEQVFTPTTETPSEATAAPAVLPSTRLKRAPMKSSSIPPPNSSIPGESASAVQSRSGSPAPSLEAFLLDRKRRQVASGATTPNSGSTTNLGAAGGGATGATTQSSRSGSGGGGKGSKFKSSPLSGEAGAHVRPSMKRDASDSGAGGGVVSSEDPNEPGRIVDLNKTDDPDIPDQKDKEGPDKEA